jgi:hypothetical protein
MSFWLIEVLFCLLPGVFVYVASSSSLLLTKLSGSSSSGIEFELSSNERDCVLLLGSHC